MSGMSSQSIDLPRYLPEQRDLPLHELSVRSLVSPAEVKDVMHLRKEINLSANAAAGADFDALEKKETNWGLYMPLNCMAKSSGPYGRFQCSMG